MIHQPPAAPMRNLVIACITDHPKAVLILRTARSKAQAMRGVWRAVFVETPSQVQQPGDGAQERMLRLLTLAEQMGGEAVQMEAESIEKGLALQLEKETGRTALVVIGSVEPTHRMAFRGVLPWMRLARLASQSAPVELVPLSGEHYRRGLVEALHLRSLKPMHFFYALLAVGVAHLAAFGLKWLLPPALFRINDQNIGLLFMIACAFAAGRFGLLPGLVASIAGFLSVNYYFTVPYHILKLETVTDFLNMALFLFAALLISLFTSQMRGYARNASRREVSTQALFTLYRIASTAFSREQALEKLQQTLEDMLEVDVAFFMPQVMKPERIEPVFPRGMALEEADRKAVDACWADMKTTGFASPYNPGTQWRFEPMISPMGEIGVFGVRPRRLTHMDAWFGRLLTAIADQTASVLEHIDLERSMEETHIREEREKLRSMLLSSVSHDFKTPLAGIIGALSVHKSLGERLTQQKRDELIESAIGEAQRLDSFITNILDMTRLESGSIQFKKEWHDFESIITNVTKRLRQRLSRHEVNVHACSGIEVHLDAMMTEQVLQNLLDNACKYNPPGTRIEIGCSVDVQTGMLCTVRDHGAGLPPDKLEGVFDKYARLRKKDMQVAGTGLGLSISKAVIEAQGGWITAANHPDGGAVFTFCLPEWRHTDTQSHGEDHAPAEQAHRRH